MDETEQCGGFLERAMAARKSTIDRLICLLAAACTPAAADPCNGDTRLCDRPYNEVAHLTTHNAYSNRDYGFIVPSPNQLNNVTWQLEGGVRALMLDTHEYLGRAYLCHGTCGPWGRKKLRPVLTEIKSFLDSNPNEVVTIIFESYLTEERTEASFVDTDLIDHVYAHPIGAPWPTLLEMINAGTRLMVFTDDAAATLSWHHYVWDHAWELPFEYANIEEFTCEDGRGTPGADLFIFNHWIASPLGSDRGVAKLVNQYPLLHNRAVECWGHSAWNPANHLPNFVTVDHFDLGAGSAVVWSLNDTWPVPPLWMTQTDFARGDSASLRVSGLDPGARVYFGAGFDGPGIGETLPGLQGTRLDLLGPVIPIGEAAANPGGVATLTMIVPTAAPPGSVSTQAVVPLPGQPALKSIALDGTVQ